MIETERLLMRKFTIEDADAVLAYGSNAEVYKYTGDDPVHTLEEAKKILTDVIFQDYEKYGYGRLALIEKASGKVIGFHGFKYLPEFGLPDIGYRMLPEYWGKGYATEAGRACMEYGYKELGFKEIIGLTMVGNSASDNVLLKLGFRESEKSPIEEGNVKLFVHHRDR